MRRALLGALLCLPLVAGCGEEDEPPRPATPVLASGRGLTVELPAGWHRADESLTPMLGDPREVLSVATFVPVHRETRCAHVPGSALEDLGATGAFVTLQERGLGAGPHGFPARPERFGPGLGGPSEASDCVPGARFADHWFTFSDGDRRFHALVAFGPDAPATVRGQAWAVLDSLRIDPAVRPEWTFAG